MFCFVWIGRDAFRNLCMDSEAAGASTLLRKGID